MEIKIDDSVRREVKKRNKMNQMQIHFPNESSKRIFVNNSLNYYIGKQKKKLVQYGN